MDSTKDTTQDVPEAQSCFKCKTEISHVPYKFEGKFFHARCLLCNTCGKRLVGKPFVSSQSQIFCDIKCQEIFHTKGPKIQPSAEQLNSNGLPPANGFHGSIDNFSLNGLLDTMQNHLYQGQANGHHHHHHHHRDHQHHHRAATEGRVTDYPTAYSGYNQSFQSETDSLSTVSESSFTSEGSHAYDANRRPKKKILKKSSGPRKKHKRRVRWNLDNLESFSDIETASLDSSSSVSSTGHSFLRAQDMAALHMYGHDLPATPTMKPPEKVTEYPRQTRTQKLFSPPPTTTPPPYTNGLTPTSKAPGMYRTYSGSIYQSKVSNSSPSSHRLIRTTSSPDEHYQRERSRSLSFQDLNQGRPLHQSSPISSKRTNGRVGGVNGSNSSLNDSVERLINVPILYLDDVPELNESNPQERDSRHLFEFPPVSSQRRTSPVVANNHLAELTAPMGSVQRSRSSSDVSNPQSLTSNSSSSMSSTSSFSSFIPISPKGSPKVKTNSKLNRVVENDEEPDYDHLEAPTFSNPPAVLMAKDRLKPLQADNQWYSNDDIEEALQIIEGSEADSEEEEEARTPSTPRVVPPPVPPKQKNLKHLPPCIPPKKQVLDNILAQKVITEGSTLNGSIDRLILSPPKEFKGSSEPHKAQQHRKHDPLHSPSSETLMPYESDSNLTPLSLEAEVHPEPRPNASPKYSWSRTTSNKTMDERIIEGAEDTGGRTRSPNGTPVKPWLISSPVNVQRNTARHHDMFNGGTHGQGSYHNGPLQRHNSFSSKISRHEEQRPLEPVQLHRSKTLPRNLMLTKEDRAVLKWHRERPQMKPLIVDTDKEINEMLAELEGNRKNSSSQRSPPKQSVDSQDRKPLLGTKCFSCMKPIEDAASLVEFASRTYHCSCFCCSHCRCMLKGTQIYTLKGVLMCASDYNKIMAKQQKEQLSKINKLKKNNRSQSASSLSAAKSREDIVISPPIQSLERPYCPNTTMV